MDNGDLNVNTGCCIAGILSVTHLHSQLVNRTSHVSRVQVEVGTEFHKLPREHTGSGLLGCLRQTATAAFHQRRSDRNKDRDTCCHDNKSTERNALVFISIPSSRSTYDQPNCRSPASICECQDRGLLTVFDRLSNRRVLG